jgi:hypothetical protein
VPERPAVFREKKPSDLLRQQSPLVLSTVRVLPWHRLAMLRPEPFPVEGLSMSFADAPSPAEVDCLLRNAELRDAIEPYLDDDTHGDIDFAGMPTEVENRYLESMLAWEHAPLTPVAHWFSPPLVLSPAVGLTESQLRERLWDVIDRLYAERIVLDFTDHLTDRELYNLIRREILPTPIKRVDLPDNYFHWDCSAIGELPEFVVGQWYPEPVLDSLIWLTYYADDAERAEWEADFGVDLPPREVPPYPRALPSAPV